MSKLVPTKSWEQDTIDQSEVTMARDTLMYRKILFNDIINELIETETRIKRNIKLNLIL